MAKHTLNETRPSPTLPSIKIKPKKTHISAAFQELIPVKTPSGDLVEPTLRLKNQDYFEIDLERAGDRQILELAKLYKSGQMPQAIAQKFDLGLALIPANWAEVA